MTQKEQKIDTGHEPIQWIDDTIPLSPRFDDTYYSKVDGLAETRHVFLDGNDLEPRFECCRDTFTIAELGFGTGLNFLTTLDLWRKTAPATAQLNFISFEAFPVSKDEMLQALSRWPALEVDAQALSKAWQPGREFLSWQQDNVSLTVFLADANIRLPQLDMTADAWFLDGFSPTKNPELWNETLMQSVFERTASGGTFATYTAAGWVRRTLASAGFEVIKMPGFGTKRDMTRGFKPA